jgi:hypothetical protein
MIDLLCKELLNKITIFPKTLDNGNYINYFSDIGSVMAFIKKSIAQRSIKGFLGIQR